MSQFAFPAPESVRWVMPFVLRRCDGGCKRMLRFQPSTEPVIRLHCSVCKRGTSWEIVK